MDEAEVSSLPNSQCWDPSRLRHKHSPFPALYPLPRSTLVCSQVLRLHIHTVIPPRPAPAQSSPQILAFPLGLLMATSNLTYMRWKPKCFPAPSHPIFHSNHQQVLPSQGQTKLTAASPWSHIHVCPGPFVWSHNSSTCWLASSFLLCTGDRIQALSV